VTVKGKRFPVSKFVTKERPFYGSTNFHDLGNSLLENEITYHQRQIANLNKMPLSYYTNKDISYHQNLLTSKRKELQHRRNIAKEHNLRW
jgi:hypothetical protein